MELSPKYLNKYSLWNITFPSAFSSPNVIMTANNIYNPDFWLKTLGAAFRNASVDKGLSALDNMLTYDGVTNIVTGNTITSNEVIEFWGKGFQDDEYELLQRKYEQYTDNYPSKTIQEVNLIKTICMLEVLRERAIVKNDQKAFENLTNQISKRMEELNVLPSKMKQYGEDDNLIYGNLIATIEKNEPITDSHKEYDDVDRIKWWINRYFLNPIKKLMMEDSSPYTEEDEKGYGE